MPSKLKLNFLFFVIYLSGIGQYFLGLLIGGETIITRINLFIDASLILITFSWVSFQNRYLKYLIALLVISTFTFLNSDTDFFWHINGLRAVLILVCCFLLFEAIYQQGLAGEFIIRFRKFAFVFLAIQIPVSILQFIEYGPGDNVSGTIGQGGSGVLTFSIFLLVFLLLELDTNSATISKKLKRFFRLSVFLIPVALNETKITFVLLGIFFLSFINLKKLGSSFLMTLVSISAILVFSFFYSTQENVNYDNPLKGIYSQDFLTGYLMGDEAEYQDVPRMTKIALASQILKENGKIFFGEDYGAFSGEDHSTEFKYKHEWLLKGSRPLLFFLLISGGVFLILLLLTLFFRTSILPLNHKGLVYSKPLLIFINLLFIIILFYNDGFRFQILAIIFVCCLYFSKYFNSISSEFS